MAGDSPGRIFILGLDGATFDLIDPWVAQGKLPAFSALFREGVKGVLESVVPPLTTPAWVSFQTGRTPASHGLFSWVRRVGVCDQEPFNRTHITAQTLDSILSRHGLRVGFVNVPCTYPPRQVNGFVVSGLETPSRESSFTYPPSLKDELESRFDYEIERTQKFRSGQERSFIQIVETVEKKRAEAVLALMSEKPWDVFMVVFRGTDILSHALWRHHDPSHPAHTPEGGATFGTALLEHYQFMDDIMGRIRNLLSPQDSLLVMSDHGSCGYWRHVFLDNLFLRHGLLRYRKDFFVSLRRLLFHLGATPANAMEWLSRLHLRNLIRRIVPQDRRIRATNVVSLGSAIDWSRTAAFPFGGAGQIYINLKGREPQGCVDSGAQYDAIVERVIRALSDLTEPLTGESMVAEVLRKEDLGADLLNPLVPDLFVRWTQDRYGDFGGVGIHKGLMTGIQTDFSGAHSMRGIFLAAGPYFLRNATIEGARIIDLAPTILYLLDLPVPSDMDGRVLREAFIPERLVGKPLRFEETHGDGQEGRHTYSLEEKELVEERLRTLGYIS